MACLQKALALHEDSEPGGAAGTGGGFAHMLSFEGGLNASFCCGKAAVAHDVKVEDVQKFLVNGAPACNDDWQLLCNVIR